MNKATVLFLLILTWIMTACSGTSSTAAPAFNSQNPGLSGTASPGELSAPMQVAIGTIKLDGTENAVTAEQAKELLPLWETLQSLYNSDTAADQEVQALVEQIQETMTAGQMQSITALHLTRQDMFALMQPQANTSAGTTSRNAANGDRGGFGPGGGFPGGPPPDGGEFPGGGQSQGSTGSNSTDTTSSRPAMDPNRIPTPLIQAVIEYLQQKSGT